MIVKLAIIFKSNIKRLSGPGRTVRHRNHDRNIKRDIQINYYGDSDVVENVIFEDFMMIRIWDKKIYFRAKLGKIRIKLNKSSLYSIHYAFFCALRVWKNLWGGRESPFFLPLFCSSYLHDNTHNSSQIRFIIRWVTRDGLLCNFRGQNFRNLNRKWRPEPLQ